MRKTAILLITLLIAACQTVEERSGIPYMEATLNNIDSAVENDRLLDALWLCELYAEQGNFQDTEVLQEKRSVIISEIKQKLGDSGDADPEVLLAMYDSLRNLGIDLSEYEYDVLLGKYTESLGVKNNHTVDWYELRTSAAGTDDSGQNPAVASWDEIIKATVTVYLDRGIKIEGGYGFKDLALGSGFFISPDGYIITNYHVIESHVDPKYEGFSRVYIKLEDFQSPKIPVKVVGWDPLFDLALLKAEVDADDIISLVRTPDLKAGERIYAIGSPGGLEKTLTSGIVSATGRPLLELGKVLQVDVPINHGNSGGPLLDEKKRLVGIVFAGAENFEGINFAIPTKYLYNSLYKMSEGGMVQYPFLGFIATETRQGLEIIYVFPGASAASAGLETGDILNAINGNEVMDYDQMTNMLESFRINSLVTVSVTRDETEKSYILKNSKREVNPLLETLSKDNIENILYPVFGMQLKLVERSPLIRKFSVVRVLPGSAAEEQGMSVDDTLKLHKYKYLADQNALMLDISVRKKTSAMMDIRMQIGAYLYASGVF